MNSINAISPIDGRYRRHVERLTEYFSEYALIKYRVRVEIEYFISLVELDLPALKEFDKSKFSELRDIYTEFNEEDAQKVKDIEKVTNHDVKAVEYFIKDRFDEMGLSEYKEFLHFALTSQDINNTATPMSLKEAHENELLPLLDEVVEEIEKKAEEWKNIPLLAHTHGQPASPTLLGKEFKVFSYRLNQQLAYFALIPFQGKFGGATGNFNAHNVAYPDVDWIGFSEQFLDKLGLERQTYTTQIENYDNMGAYFDNLKRINTILIDLARDMWTYISMDYFKQKIKEGEVGSSAMPHKVNPIDFENAEGNLGIANALLEHLSSKLPISRLQRDLTDSTVTRNIGVPISHTIIALRSMLRGLDKVILNEEAINQDLEENWAVVAEAIQTILRSINYPNPYEALKGLTRTNEKIDAKTISRFIDGLDIDDELKEEMKKITPHNYTGVYGQ